ncbi:MAG: DUF1552 domain-containing protein [Myxococcales bacterium]|nr:DUF1552 domain-containing protein [Myxococcales bacterium]
MSSRRAKSSPLQLRRRHVLRGAGGLVLGLPFLEYGQPAKAATPPTRFVVFFTSNGCVYDRWLPAGTETNFTLSESLSPLASHKDKLVVMKGLELKSATADIPGHNGHDVGMSNMLTAHPLVEGPSGTGEFSVVIDGSAGGISIDQAVANHIGGDTPFRSIELGVEARHNPDQILAGVMSYRAPFEPNYPRNSPKSAFQEIFGAVGVDVTELAAIRARRGSILDAVLEDYGALNKKLGAEDRKRLDAHATSLRAVELRLEKRDQALIGCDLPELRSAFQYPEVGALQMELLVRALACDLTRVGSLQWSTAQSGTTFSWLGHSIFHHQLSHDADTLENARDKLVEIHGWYAERFAELLSLMANTDDGDGSLLDHTVVLWCNELGNPWDHTYANAPFLLAGGGGGQLKGGRLFDASGRSHNDLFVSIQQMFGIESNTFGHPDFSTGPLAGL